MFCPDWAMPENVSQANIFIIYYFSLNSELLWTEQILQSQNTNNRLEELG
jgi:hypothetical protein